MIVFRVLRVIITTILVIFLLGVGFFALLVYSVDHVVLTSSYFGEDLLYSGTYSNLYNYVVDTFVPVENTDDMQSKAEDPAYANIMYSLKPTMFSNISADYLSDWMSYVLGEIPKNQIPLLNLAPHKDSIYSSAVALMENEEFRSALLEQYFEANGYSAENYSQEELDDLLTSVEVRNFYTDSINEVLNDPSSLYYQTTVDKDPLAVLKYVAPDLSEQELLFEIKNSNGILVYYQSIVNLIFAGILACLGIILILWIKNLSLAFLLDGMVIILSGIPLFVMSVNEKAFNYFVLSASKYLPSSVPDISNHDFYNNLAIMPVIDYMLIVSGITIATGLMFLLFSVLLKKDRKPKSSRPKALSL